MLKFTNVRPFAHDSDHTNPCDYTGLTALMLDVDSSCMSGMDCVVAYICPDRSLFYESDIENEADIKKKHPQFSHMNLLLTPEERCYLKPQCKEGALELLKQERESFHALQSRHPGKQNAEWYWETHLPYQAEKLGRVYANCAEFL